MSIQNFEKFDKDQRGFGLSIFVVGKSDDTTPKNFGGLAPAEVKILVHLDDKRRVNEPRIAFFLIACIARMTGSVSIRLVMDSSTDFR
jgi:hypothetical protein